MKKKKNKFLVLFYLVFLVYSIYYLFYLFGYAKVVVKNETVLTAEAMKEFENDINLGKDVTLENYLTINDEDYTTKVSLLGNKVASLFEIIMDKGIEEGVDIIKKLFS